MNRLIVRVALTLAAGAAVLAPGRAHAQTAARVGEIRLMAVGVSDAAGVAQLHQDGWIEAGGQVLAADAYPELFTALGRTFSDRHIAAGLFAVPDLNGTSIDSVNPFHVLGPGDLVTSGKPTAVARRPAIASWMYTGRPVTAGSRAGNQ